MPVFSSIAAATIAGGAIAGGSAIAAGVMGKSAAQDAADVQLQGTRESIAAQKEMAAQAEKFQREQADIARKELEPFKQAQLKALGEVQALGQADNPLYQQMRSSNTEAIQRQLAAQGLLRSKSQVDLLSNLELGLNQQRIGTLSGLANLGAAQGQAQISNQLGSSLGSVYSTLGNKLGETISSGAGQQAGLAMAQGQMSGDILKGFNNAAQGTLSGLVRKMEFDKLFPEQTSGNAFSRNRRIY